MTDPGGPLGDVIVISLVTISSEIRSVEPDPEPVEDFRNLFL